MLRFIKTYAIFISMIIGVITFPVLSILAPYTKYFLFTMLFITYCKVSLKHLKFRPLHLRLSILQLLLSIALYIIIYPLNKDLAIGSLICVIVPTATSAPVVTGLLGGSIEFVTTYSIISSVGAALIVPFIFPLIGGHGINNEDISFLYCSWIIGYKVIPLLICPLILAIIVKNALPYIHKKIEDRLSISFWLWVTALSILMAKTANDIFYMDKDVYNIAAIIAIVTSVVFAIHFCFGRLVV